MKKLFALALAAAMTLSLAACAPKAPKDEANRTTFAVGFDAEFPPFGYKNDAGEYVGFDLSLAEEVCKRNGWELKKMPISWDSKDLELSGGNIDCIWNGFTMNGRENDYTWSEPYVDNSQVFVVPADSGIATWEDLAGKRVAAQADSSALKALQDKENQENLDLAASFQELSQPADYNTAFMDLEAGAIDAIAMDVGVASYQMNSRGADKFVILEKTLAAEQYAIGFLKGNTALRDQVQKTLDEMAADGAVAKIVEDWAKNGLSAESVTLGS
ncbi:MAG: amino acid ABC transporter substrate-binding protein [Oscillospiraceae bacterium]